MAQTLKFGNGTWATKKGSTLAFNDEDGNYKPLPFTTTRATSATRVNKEGLIEVVESDRPRIDYTDTSDGVLLLEKAATNLQTYSSDLASVYAPTNITQTSNYGASPDSSLTSTRVVLANLTDSRSVETLTGTLTNGVVYTFSCYYKGVKGESTYMYFLSSTGGVSVSKEIIFTGDWQRESITFTAGSASNYTYIVDVRQGASTATDFEVWGAQVEVGSLSSYIPTQGSAVTRVADTASGSGNSEVFNDSEGVLMAELSIDANDGNFRFLSISDGTSTNAIWVYYRSDANQINFRVIAGGVSSFDDIYTINNATENTKLLLKYKENDFSAWVNGFEVLTDNSGITFSGNVLNELEFSRPDGVNNFYGKTKEIAYYNTVLTDLELETLTSYRSLSELVTELNLNTL